MAKAKAMRSVFTHIRSLRENSNIKQGPFADMAALNRNHYSELEWCSTNCGLDNLIVISAYLDTPPWVILEDALKKDWDKIVKEITKKPGHKWK